MAIESVGAAGLGSTAPVVRTAGSSAAGFGDLVVRLVEGLEDGQASANAAVDAMVNKTGDVHDAMIALQRSELALQLVVQVRNKLVQAYQDIMRMPV